MEPHAISGSQHKSPINNAYLSQYKIIRTFKLDEKHFTQGLAYDPQNKTVIWQSAGLKGKSLVRSFKLDTSHHEDGVDGRTQTISTRKNDFNDFGEGITVYDGKVVQLTWQNKVRRIFERSSPMSPSRLLTMSAPSSLRRN